MLVLSRKAGERVLIGDSIWLTIVRVDGNQVRVGIEAPRSIPVLRQELAARPELRHGLSGVNAAKGNTICSLAERRLADLTLV